MGTRVSDHLTRLVVFGGLCLSASMGTAPAHAKLRECSARLQEVLTDLVFNERRPHLVHAGIPYLGRSMAVVHVDPQEIRMLVEGPGQSTPLLRKYPVNVPGRLEEVMRQVRSDLLGQGVSPNDARVMLSSPLLAEASRTPGLKSVLDQQARSLATRVEELDPVQETRLLYRSIVGRPALPESPAIAVEVIPKRIQILPSAETAAVRTMAIPPPNISGSPEPFSAAIVAADRRNVRRMIDVEFFSARAGVDLKTPVIFRKTSALHLLRELHLENTGEDIYRNGLSLATIRHYLSPEGLAGLQGFRTAQNSGEARKLIEEIPRTLLVAEHFLEKQTGIETVRIGAAGGVLQPAMDDLARILVTERMARKAGKLSSAYEFLRGEALNEIQEVFPEKIFGPAFARAKNSQGVQDKLVQKAVVKKQKVRDFNSAEQLIGDGIGVRLLLRDPGSAGVERFVTRLIDAILSGKVAITSLHNYRGPEGIPYLSESQVQRIREASRTRGQEVEMHPPEKQVKDSGYTTLQMNVQFSNGATGEFQVRGGAVDRISDIEHFIYDIRRGKTLPARHGTAALQRTVEQVISLTPAEHEDYLKYLNHYYQWARLQETGMPAAKPPQLPDAMRGRGLSLEKLQALLKPGP